jgi:hypothetical protein
MNKKNERLVVGIHQPDLMPWFGFWSKLIKSDILVILDHTHNNPRDSNSWMRRVRMIMGHQTDWFSVSLTKEKGKIGLPINEIEINIIGSNFKKTYTTLQQTYKKAPYFNEGIHLVEQYIEHPSTLLMDRNIDFIKEIISSNEMNTKLIYSSSLNCYNSSTELLVEILKKLDATVYLSGDGASGYMDIGLFKKENIEIEYNNFVPFQYNQFNSDTFKEGLSVVDYIMNYGANSIKPILQNISL